MGLDTENMEAGKRDAMEIAEAAREEEWKYPSFVLKLFSGQFQPHIISPFPEQSEEDRKIGAAFLKKVNAFLLENLDPDEIDATGEIPDDVIKGLVDLGVFGMKIPKEYGGAGLSQINYNRVVESVASYCGSTTMWISAHQSIGVPTPLKQFGTPEQKKKYLPRLAKGELSAFSLTEPNVGSDPAKMETIAEPTEDGEHFIINGTKLWTTNGPVADILIVMARTPSKMVNGREKKQITAFIVEKDMPGVEIEHRCDFMGLNGGQIGVLKYNNVKVPKENILWGEGNGLKLAFITLNTGRLTLPAACTGIAKRCLQIVREWSNERVQWGSEIGKHDAIAGKIGTIAADTFALESVVLLCSALADRGGTDFRLEAAMAKLFASETSWKVIDEALQIRGGRGYETARSLKARGEKPYPIERIFRDNRINKIVEGSSEIMHLFIAREALDPHMQVGKDMLNPKLPVGKKIKAIGKVLAYYAKWFPQHVLYWSHWPKYDEYHGYLAKHLRFIDAKSHTLARTIFYCIGRYQAKLELKQNVLARVVDVGMELFAMSAVCSRAQSLYEKNPGNRTPLRLADLFCRQARIRVKHSLRTVFSNTDRRAYRIARMVLDGELNWLEDGIVKVDFDELIKK